MRPKFNKKQSYGELEVIDEIVRARLFEDYERLDVCDNPEEMREAYSKVLRYITNCDDKRLKKLVNNF